MSAPAAKTIDLLILDLLREGGRATVRQVAMTWGEDHVRVREWLEKFRKPGLCFESYNGLAQPCYVGRPLKIAAYLRSRENGPA